ncbi:ATP-binding protein [Nocardia sp. bgisy134]|uniref:ATP-binding protein n=1 Tax=Nocardia sp. bgisy134 TaxID=3413789 RepID=UPI003D70C6A7
MSHRLRAADNLVVPSNFIRAARESGYVSLSTALAELVDNSLQAGASDVAISINRPIKGVWPQIQVEDNGEGMDRAKLASCLRFGGSSRFDERTSFGRFGMGLPAASVSQARKVEVVAWQAGQPAQSVRLDVDEIAAGMPVDLAPRPAGSAPTSSGCRVVWYLCDRVEYRRLAWLERALHRDLGRIYRRFLSGDLRLTINDMPVQPVDPTLLTTDVEGRTAQPAFDTLRYEVATASGDTAFVTVRFTILPVHSWHHLDNVTKRQVGIVGHGGVTILRAGREIAIGWHLMGSKRKENYDDWWRCEIEFDPVLDEHFGITINKQGIRPSAALRDAIEPELESIARMLNARVRQAFEEVKFKAAAAASCRIATAADADLPALKGRGRARGPLNYSIGSAPLPVETMFRSRLKHRTLDVTLNIDHPAFAALYHPLITMEDTAATKLRTAIELFLLSFARTTLLMGRETDEMLRIWSATYGRMVQRS